MRPILFFLIAAGAGLSRAQAPLEPRFHEQLNATPQPAWVGYTVPAMPDRHDNCNYGDSVHGVRAPGPVHLEPSGRVQVLFRIGQHRVEQIRPIPGDCQIDTDGLPLRWIDNVRPAESVALLAGLAQSGDVRDGAIAAIAMHSDASADAALERFAAVGQPESMREKAIFWVGAARGPRGYEVLRRIVKEDPSEHMRDKAVFALSLSKDPRALNAMIDVAHHDASAHVRGQAIFWLAQKAGHRAVGEIAEALENDPDTEVKKKAVFALQQLPDGEGVPKLIQVARTNRNPAVRKQAMFWLGQSSDPRALAFFEEVLK